MSKPNESKHVAAFRASPNLKAGEKILLSREGYIGSMMGKGKDKQHNGAFILTNKRAIFFRSGIFGQVFETMPIAKITSVETKTMMGHKVLCLHTSHDEMEFKTLLAIEDLHDRLEALRDHHEEGSATSAPVAPAADPMEQLEKLGRLRDAGVVTDAEFEQKKADLLSRL